MSENKPYNRLGLVLDSLARSRNVRGVTAIEKHVKERTGRGPTASGWQQIMTGETKNPRSEHLEAFHEAFELTPEEEVRLALARAFPARFDSRLTAA